MKNTELTRLSDLKRIYEENEAFTKKPLGITEEQKIKLMEMANTCFTYDLIFKGINGEYLIYNGDVELFNDPQPKPRRIHWFEFCLTYLLDAIWDKTEKYPSDHIYNGLAKDRSFRIKSNLIKGALENHPVDYLYSKFKEL